MIAFGGLVIEIWLVRLAATSAASAVVEPLFALLLPFANMSHFDGLFLANLHAIAPLELDLMADLFTFWN